MASDVSVEGSRLLRAARRGDVGARRRIVDRHLDVVRRVASRYAGLGLPEDDLVQEGCLGLLDSIDRYDASRGVPFEAFARFRVRIAIRDALTARARLIRLPKHVSERLRQEPEPPPVPVAVELVSPDGHADADGLDPEERLLALERARLLDAAVSRLPPRQRLVIMHRYGLGGAEESLRDVACELRLSPRRTLTLERQALATLRRELADV